MPDCGKENGTLALISVPTAGAPLGAGVAAGLAHAAAGRADSWFGTWARRLGAVGRPGTVGRPMPRSAPVDGFRLTYERVGRGTAVLSVAWVAG